MSGRSVYRFVLDGVSCYDGWGESVLLSEEIKRRLGFV